MIDLLKWMLAVEALGLAALPLAWAIHPRAPARALASAKPLGILLVGLAAWACLVLRLYPYSRALVLGVAAAVALPIWGVWGRACLTAVRALSRREVLLGGTAELVFAGAAAWQSFMVSLNPSMYLSEIPMNFAFVSALNRSSWLPPLDPWLAGHTINYYYFGHFLISTLIKLIDVSPAIGFALAGITLFASVVALIYAIVVDVADRQAVGAGRARVAVLAVAGCGAVLMGLFNGNLVPFFMAVTNPAIVASWWSQGEPNWWQLPYHAHGDLSELPWRTYLLHYTHSFDMALPFLLLVFAWGLRYWSSDDQASARRSPLFWATLALPWSGASLISPWVLPAAGLFAAALMLRDVLLLRRGAIARQLVPALAGWGAVLAVGLLLARLFVEQSRFVGQQALPTLDPASARDAIPPRTLILQFGVQLAGAGIVVLARARALRIPLLIWAGPAALALGALVALAWLGLAAALFTALWWLVLLCVVWSARRRGEVPFSLLLLFVAVGLNTIPFFIAIHDAPNTFFKLGFLAWIVAGIALFAELGACWAAGGPPPRWARPAIAVGTAGALFAGAWMPALAAITTTNHLRGWGPQTLDGVAFYLRRGAPGEYQAVRWLDDHADASAIVLEASGASFTPAGRIAAFTGLPAVLGWQSHEALWHEREPAVLSEIDRRASDVRRVYETLDPAEAQCLLQRYDVTYVVVGKLERAQVSLARDAKAAALGKFGRFMDLVYPTSGDLRDDETLIYQRRTGSGGACAPAR